MASNSPFAKAARACRAKGVTAGKPLMRCVAANGGMSGKRRKSAPKNPNRQWSAAQRAAQRRLAAASKSCAGSGSPTKHRTCVRNAIKGRGGSNGGDQSWRLARGAHAGRGKGGSGGGDGRNMLAPANARGVRAFLNGGR